jgi:hypothetical protein
VDTAFAAWFPFEVFDNIGDVSLFAIDAGCFECIVEQATRWANERSARKIFFVAGLLTYKHDFHAPGPLAKDGLRPGFPEVAGLAMGCGAFERRERWSRWN